MDKDKEKEKQIYENLKKNSIGPEKECKDKSTTKKVVTKVAIVALSITLAASAIVGGAPKIMESLFTPVKLQYDQKFYDQKEVYHKINTYESVRYENDRLRGLLEENNFLDYTLEYGGKRDYHYTAEDYQKLECLDETYLGAFRRGTTTNTFNEVLKSFGYNNFEDYLVEKGYVDNYGNPSEEMWRVDNTLKMHEIFQNEGFSEKGVTKK